LTDIYVDADACPVREEVYRVPARLRVKVLVVSNGSRPIRPPGISNVSMVLVGDTADAADDWIAARIGTTDVCVTSDIPLASRWLKKAARVARARSPLVLRFSLGGVSGADSNDEDESCARIAGIFELRGGNRYVQPTPLRHTPTLLGRRLEKRTFSQCNLTLV
jgi:hypothetical protein